MGILYIILTNRIDNSGSYLKGLLLVGFLGGYTTFSSFSIETVTLLENGYWLNALANVLLSTTLCIFSSWAGMVAGKQFVSIEKQVPALVEYENQGE